jgi:hypothetical protein
MQKQTTTWAQNATLKIAHSNGNSIYKYQRGPIRFDIRLLDDSLWIISHWDDKTSRCFSHGICTGRA